MPDLIQTVLLCPRDPLIVRDARPFSADPGARAETMGWPLPQTIAGAIRSHVGDALGWSWDDPSEKGGPAQARCITVRGPFLAARRSHEKAWEIYYPAPADGAIYRAENGAKRIQCMRPLGSQDGWCDLPSGLLPVGYEDGDDFKPELDALFWSWSDTRRWLREPRPRPEIVPTKFLGALPRDTRVHVRIDPEISSHVEGALFSTTGLVFSETPVSDESGQATAIAVQVVGGAKGWQAGEALIAVGGERRLVRILPNPSVDGLEPDQDLVQACVGSCRVRLQLVTPAIFAGGWRPGWLDRNTFSGPLPGEAKVQVRLVGVAAGRRVPVSGWDFQSRRPKSLRYAAPAGSVYFFEVTAGRVDESTVQELWLRSLSDDEQDQRDGFGLCLPGIW